MKRFTILFILIMACLPSVSAQLIGELKVDATINQEGTVDFNLSFMVSEDIKRVRIPFHVPISGLQAIDAECTISQRNVIDCVPFDESFTISFKTDKAISIENNVSCFYFEMPILWDVEKITMTVKLPEGTAFSSEPMLPIWPSAASVWTDGRSIFATWVFENVKAGSTISVRTYFEPVVPPSIIRQTDYRLIIVLLLIFVLSGLFVRRAITKRFELVLSVLNEGEKMVVDVIKNEGGKRVDQRKIVAITGFSKAKVTRIIKSLEERGIIKVERVGRKNKISLRRKFFKE